MYPEPQLEFNDKQLTRSVFGNPTPGSDLGWIECLDEAIVAVQVPTELCVQMINDAAALGWDVDMLNTDRNGYALLHSGAL